jgi:hypothetical protein
MASSPSGSELIYEFQPTTPAGTPLATPNVVAMQMPDLEVQYIEWIVPPGPSGNLGWQLLYSGSLVVPQNGTWVITDNETGRWELDELPTGGAWSFQGYNTDLHNDHTVYLRFLLDPLAQPLTLEDLGILDPIQFPPAGEPAAATVPVS